MAYIWLIYALFISLGSRKYRGKGKRNNNKCCTIKIIVYTFVMLTNYIITEI